jgi:hypothetical protein
MIEEIKLASKFDAKGFKQAESASAKLGKSVKKLAGAFGVAFAAAEVIQFGKESVRAFLEDEKAAAKLTTTINNLGLSLSADSLGRYVERLSLATGVVDDQLRPALQSLLQVTGSATLSQQLLGQAVEISRGSQEDLLTVANDLSQAYVGNTKGLRKYNLGLTKSELQTASFATILARFNKLFTGANAAYLETYAGKMELLTVAAGEAKEVIGKGLVDGLTAVSGEQAGIQGTADAMMNLAQAVGDVSLGFGTLIGKLNATPIVGDLLKAWGWIQNNTGVLGSIRFLGEQERLKKERSMMPSGTVGSGISQGALLQSNKVEKEAILRAKELAKQAAKLTKDKKQQLLLEKAKLALTKAAANFDITKINLAAALKGKVSEEDRKRLLALQAIENDNGELALKYISELDYARKMAAEAEEERLRKLAESEKARQAALLAQVQARIEAVQSMIDKVQRKIEYNAAQALADVMAASAASSSGVAGYSGVGSGAYDVVTNPYAGTYYGETGRDPMPVSVNISLDGQVFQSAVVGAVNQASASGTQLSYTQTAVR